MLGFSILLEIWVRWLLPITSGHDGFYIWPNIDNVMHFFWGLNIFLFFVLMLRWTPIEGLLGVYIWQMGWELSEMVGDIIIAQPPHMLDHFFLDGIKDTAVDIAGAVLGWALLLPTKMKTKDSRPHPRIARAMLTHLIILLPVIPIGTAALLINNISYDSLAIAWIVLAIPATYIVMKIGRKRSLQGT